RGSRDRRRPAGARLQRRAAGHPRGRPRRRGGRVSAATVSESKPAPAPAPNRPRPWAQTARMLQMEIRHSAFVWCLPLLVVLFIYDPYRTASTYPALWPLRSTVVLNKFWPDMVVFAAGFSAWSGTREGRRNVSDLLATTARP